MKSKSPNKDGWFKVHTTDYYGEYEEAWGLCNGDDIQVQWPSGHQTLEHLHIKRYRTAIQIDMNGGPDYVTVQRLGILTSYEGVDKIFVPLSGLKIRRAPTSLKVK